MQVTIEVKDADEGAQIVAGLNQPDVRAFVVVAGILGGLPDQRSRGRVLSWMDDVHDQQRQNQRAEARERERLHHCDCGHPEQLDPDEHAVNCDWRQKVEAKILTTSGAAAG